MRGTWIRAALLVLLAAPAAAAQQGPGAVSAAQAQPDEQERGAWQFLREHQGELGITPEQQDRLRVIALRLGETNAPFRRQLREERQRYLAQRRAELLRMTPAERQAEMQRLRRQGGQVPESMRPLLERIRANQRAAMREAQGVLTADQKQRARALFRQWRQERQGKDGGRGALRRGRQRAGGVRPRAFLGRGLRP